MAAIGRHKVLKVSKFIQAGAQARKVVAVPLGVAAAAGGVFAWQNPEGAPIVVDRVTIDVTTVASGAGTVSVGKAADGVTSAANLVDTLDVHSAAGTFDNIGSPGSGGKPLQRLGATDFVTGSKASGALAGLVGNAYIHYFVL